MTEKTTELAFEPALEELEALVSRMERGELSLEDSLQHYARGVALTQRCQQALQDAEQQVQILMEKLPHAAALEYPGK